MFYVTLLNQIYWVGGATLGGVFGSYITFSTEGLEFVMTALFVVIFLDQWMKEERHHSLLIGLGASLIALLIFGSENFLLISMALLLIFLLLFRIPIELLIRSIAIKFNFNNINHRCCHTR